MRSLLAQRSRRILLPLIIALFTIEPANGIVTAYVSAQPSSSYTGATKSTEPPPWLAAAKGDQEEIEVLLSDRGNIEARTEDGATDLHLAILFGRNELVEFLLNAGADTYAPNRKGEPCVDMVTAPLGFTPCVAGLLSVEIRQQDLVCGRRKIAMILDGRKFQLLLRTLMEFPLLGHLWFLSFLYWLVPVLPSVCRSSPTCEKARMRSAPIHRSVYWQCRMCCCTTLFFRVRSFH